jgi:uncharacterized protein
MSRRQRASAEKSGMDGAQGRDFELRHGSGNDLEVILKITERCNIACTYCYFFFGGDESFNDKPGLIAPETISHFAKFIEEGVQRYRLERVRIVFHGGEPLLMPKKRMRALLEAIRTAAQPARLQLTVQTNAMLVDEEWIALFQEFGVYVGVSLDGPPEYHDRFRIDKRGRGTYERTARGIETLMRAAADGRISLPGLLCVINPQFPVEKVYSHFVEHWGFRNLDFLLPDSTYQSIDRDLLPRVEGYLLELWRLYSNERRRDVRIRFFDKILQSFLMPPFFNTVMFRYQQRKHILFTVGSDGSIAPDDILRVANPDLMRLPLRLGQCTIQDVVCNSRLHELAELGAQPPTPCRTCEWANICRGGDLYHRYDATSGFDNPSVYCAALFAVHGAVAEFLLRNGASYETLRRRAASASYDSSLPIAS